MRRTLTLALFLSTCLPLNKAETLKYTGIVVSGKTKLKCSFTLIYTSKALTGEGSNTHIAVDLRRSKVACKPKNKKPIKITNYKIENKDPPCVFYLSMTITKGKGKLTNAQIECLKPTTPTPTTQTTTSTTTTTTMPTTTATEVPVPMSNCGPKDCNIWCDESEKCQEEASIVCVKEPCCPRWSCKGIIPPPSPTPTPPAPSPTSPPPTIPPSSACCKERIYEKSNYILVGVEDSLPSCGNDCIYRKQSEGNDGQLFCFPTSYSDLQNQCGSETMRPKPLVGFSPWSEWTECDGGCEGGRSTRERSCTADISDDLSCEGPTKQVRNCETSCEADSMERQQGCTYEEVNVNGYPCTYHFIPRQPTVNWQAAQERCQKMGGKLWEPTSEAEYSAVVSAVDSQTNGAAGKCMWWLGLFNWNDGSPDSEDAYLASTVTSPPATPPNYNEPSPRNGVVSSFITVTDGNDRGTQNCVITYGGWNVWIDLPCTFTNQNAICQVCPPPCSCSYNNRSYPCGSLIKRNPHCCSETVCNKEGIIEDIQVHTDENGKPASGCCVWKGRLIKDGEEFGPFWRRYVCCRGEILSKRWWWPWKPFPLPVKPISSVLPIAEGLETIVQENSYSNSTGILEIKVPAHKNYTDSVFLLHQDSDTSMLKTSAICQVSSVPPYIDVSEMAEELKNLEKKNDTATEINTVTTYVLKARKKRYAIKKREELLPEVQNHCQNEPVIETEDLNVNQTVFEKYNAGEVVLIEKEKNTRACETYYACSKEGPIACGYGWENPDPDAPVPGFTFHQVSDGSICVSCNKYIPIPGTPNCTNGFCLCKDIINKQTLMDCVIEPDTEVAIEEEGDIIHQTLHYNNQNQARSISINSPSHNNLQSLEIVMHAATSGYWHGHVQNNHLMKLGDDCFVSTLPTNIFPVDLALGIQEIKKGNNITGKADEIETQGVLVGLQPLEDADKNALHPDIKSSCSNSEIKDFKEMPVTKEQSDDLRNGKIIFIDAKATKNTCQLMSAATTNNNSTSCWRWPNPGTGQQVFVHHIVTSVITVTCCKNLPGFDTCCDDVYPDYCICDDITQQNFETCIPPLFNEVSAQDLWNETVLNVSQQFIYDRANGGSMRIEVEEHKDYNQSTLIFNDTTMVLKNGNEACAVFSGLPSVSSPFQVAMDVENWKTEFGKEIKITWQLREDYILVKSSESPEITESLDICQNYFAADLQLISPTDYENLEAGNIIFVSKEKEISRSSDTCELKEACATNNGSSCFRFPTPGGANFFVHDVVSSPTCLQCCAGYAGYDPRYCRCNEIVDAASFEFCLGARRPDAVIVVSGVNEDSKPFGSVEILTRDMRGTYNPNGQVGCGAFDTFPEETSSATGALYEGFPTVCVGYRESEGPSNDCYQLSPDGKWNSVFKLENPLQQGGSSILFNYDDNQTYPIWLFVGGDPDGFKTEIYGNNTNYVGMFDLPMIINLPCMVKINNKEGFMLAIPKFEAATTNFAWILDGENSSWTRIPDALEKRSGPACGLIESTKGRFIVVAGGYNSATTEILNLDTFEWTMGPELPGDLYGASMVSVNDGQELLLVGGYGSGATSNILKMNSSMASWDYGGYLVKQRFSAVAMTVPVENLPDYFDSLC